MNFSIKTTLRNCTRALVFMLSIYFATFSNVFSSDEITTPLFLNVSSENSSQNINKISDIAEGDDNNSDILADKKPSDYIPTAIIDLDAEDWDNLDASQDDKSDTSLNSKNSSNNFDPFKEETPKSSSNKNLKENKNLNSSWVVLDTDDEYKSKIDISLKPTKPKKNTSKSSKTLGNSGGFVVSNQSDMDESHNNIQESPKSLSSETLKENKNLNSSWVVIDANDEYKSKIDISLKPTKPKKTTDNSSKTLVKSEGVVVSDKSATDESPNNIEESPKTSSSGNLVKNKNLNSSWVVLDANDEYSSKIDTSLKLGRTADSDYDGSLKVNNTISSYQSKIDVSLKSSDKNSFVNYFNADNFIILQANIGDNLLLEDPITGYKIGKKTFLSLKDFVRVLEFPIVFDDAAGVASGWFVTENNLFDLDMNSRQCLSRGRRFKLLSKNAIIHDNDIFVDADLLRGFFGLEVIASQIDQEVKIRSGGLLPIEQRFERQAKWEKVRYSKRNKVENISPDQFIKTPYALASVPFADMRYGYDYNKPSTGSSTGVSRLDTLITGDFLYLSNQLYTTFTDEKLTNARLTSGRKDPDAKMFGPLHATDFAVGDVFTREVPLIAATQSGNGATISNYPLEYVDNFNKATITGSSQPGWDVELYRNDSLLSNAKIGNDGIYKFINVPLSIGLNIVQLKFYGPYGEKREETRQFTVGNDLIKKGKLYYNFAANKNNENLIHIDNKDNAQATKNPEDGVGRFLGELSYGLTKDTSIAGGFVRIPDDFSSKTSDYGKLSVRSSLLGAYGRVDVVQDLQTKLRAYELEMQTTLFKNYNLSSTIDLYDKEFVSEQHTFSNDPITNHSVVRIDGPMEIPFLDFPSRISLVNTRDVYDSGNARNNLSNELSLGLSSKVSLTQNTAYITNSNQNGETSGQTFLNYLFSQQLTMRGSASYHFQPESQFDAATFSADYRFNNTLSLNFNTNYQFANDQAKSSTNYSTSLSKTFDSVVVSFGGNYSSTGNYGANINLSTSVGYDPKYGKGLFSGSPIANAGSVAVKVFLDDNGNGQFDKGEKPLEKITIIMGGGKKVETNKNGVAFVGGIQPNIPTNIKLDIDSIKDPYWIPLKKQIEINTHAGVVTNIEFPISKTGEIFGYTAFANNISESSMASNVELELLDLEGNVIKNTRSSYDGFYNFDLVPYGTYTIRTSPNQARRIGLYSKNIYRIVLNDSNQTLENKNFIIYYNERDDTGSQPVVNSDIKQNYGQSIGGKKIISINKVQKKPKKKKYIIKTTNTKLRSKY